MKHKLLKIILAVTAVIILGSVSIAIFAPQWYLIATIKFQLAERIKASDDFVYTRVNERELPTSTLPVHQFFTENGIRFDVPFSDIPKIQKFESGANLYTFENNKSIFIANGSSFNLLETLDDENLAKLYGDTAISSNFEFMKIIYNMSPADLTFRSSTKEAIRLSFGLLLKMSSFITPGPAPYQIIAFSNGSISGFQISTDQTERALIEIENIPSIYLFNMTQKEIDSIINGLSLIK